MNEQSLRQALQGLPIPEIVYFPSLTSTNDEARRRAAANAPDLTLVAAAEQTAGRGRAGHRWVTTPGSSLAFTLVLRPTTATATTHYAGLGALAVCGALGEEYGLEAQIKWPNDVLLDDRKVAGVLVETQWTGDSLQTVLVGIGVNLKPRSVPDPAALAYPATCVEAFTRRPLQPEIMLSQILGQLVRWRKLLGSPEFLAAWQERLAWKGRWVSVQDDGGAELHTGLLAGLSGNGALLLKDAGGAEVEIQAGDLHLRLD